MNKMIKKGLLLFAATMALSAFAISSTASAAIWTPANSNHTLSATNLFYTWWDGGPNGFSCGTTTLGVHARSPLSSTLDVTSAAFSSCVAAYPYSTTCNITVTPSGLPWTATGTTTSDVRLNVADLAIAYSSKPSWSCPYGGATFHASGTLTGGAWNSGARSVTYSADTGLSVNYSQPGYPLPTYAMQTTGVLTDTASPWLSLL